MKTIAILHDVALALLVGGIAGAGLSVGVLFARAPSREIAGQVGNALFARLGPAVLALAAILLAARLALQRREAPGHARTAALLVASAILVLAIIAAAWLTPRMNALWASSPHAPDGSGLTGEARSAFLRLHGLANLAYLLILLLGLALVGIGAIRRPDR